MYNEHSVCEREIEDLKDELRETNELMEYKDDKISKLQKEIVRLKERIWVLENCDTD